MTTRTKSRRGSRRSGSGSVPKKWADLFALIPKYDAVTQPAGCWFDPVRADKAVEFFPAYMTHIEGELAGQPLTLEPWQQAIVGAAFGWRRGPVGKDTRRYREVFQYVARKNGKTCFCGGLINFVAFCDGEPGAQIYSAAAEREQAALVYRQAKGMLVNNPELANQTKVYATFKSIEYPGGTVYKALSADADTKHGFNTHLVVVDELHAQPNRHLVDVLVTSTGARRQPLVWYITTADYQRESICNEKYKYACQVRDGIVNDPSFLPIIYEADDNDPWTDEKTWRKANPNLGVSVSLEYLRHQCEKAKVTPSYENTFKRLHLNLRTEQDVRWIPKELWDTGNPAVNVPALAGRDCYVGIDFGWRDDFAAMVLAFPPDEESGTWDVVPWFWLPKDGPRNKRASPIDEFLADRLITLTPGNATDIEAIYAQLNECRSRYTIKRVALDPANARKQGQDLQAEGYDVVEFVQSKRNYNEPCRFLESLLKEGRLRHGGHKVLRWMASNAAAELDGLGQLMPKKKRSSEKIDGICALTMALGTYLGDPNRGGSVYEGRGVVTVGVVEEPKPKLDAGTPEPTREWHPPGGRWEPDDDD